MPSAHIAFYLRGSDRSHQHALCSEYAGLYLGALPDKPLLFEDEDALGAQLPGLTRLEEAIQQGRISHLFCQEIGVLCRSTGELVEWANTSSRHGVSLIFAGDTLDLSSPLGKTFLYAAETLSQLERKVTAANIRDNMRELARTGRWLGGVTPTGYTSRSSGGRGHKTYRLMAHPEQATIVRHIFALFLETDSLAKVTKALEQEKVRTKNGRDFSRFTVRQILENPVYLMADQDAYSYFERLGAEICSPWEAFDGSHGMMVYNKTAQLAGQPSQQREISDWIVAVGEHEGLIDSASWIAAQQQLSRNKSKSARRPKSDHGLLAELLFCGDCGAHMRPKLTQHSGPDGEPSFFYICERKENSRSNECDMPNLPGQAADLSMSAVLAALDPEEPDILPPQPQRPATPEALASHQADMEAHKAQISQNEEGISSLVFSLIKAIDKTAYEEIMKQIDQLHQENARLHQRVTEMESLISPNPLEEHYRDSLRDMIIHWERQAPGMSIARRRATLRVLLESVTWDSEELMVKFIGGAMFAVQPF